MRNEEGREFQNKRTGNRIMSVMWAAVKKSLQCKSTTSEVHEPKRVRKPESGSTTCKSTLRDVVYGNRRVKENSRANISTMSIRSSDLINPVMNHVRFTNSGLRITRDHNSGGSSYSGSPGYPAPRSSRLGSETGTGLVPGLTFSGRFTVTESGGGYRAACCPKCGDSLAKQDAEAHHLSKHAVTEVLHGDSTRKIIEMIFKAGLTRTVSRIAIERIVKVHNPETKVAHFEEYREMVKIRTHRLQSTKKHPRCLADGNELLRFYGTTLACSLGQNGISNLCTSQRCNVCSILRHGFSAFKESDQSVLGIFTTSTSENAYKSIEVDGGDRGRENSTPMLRKALILCRVIAGRVHKPIVDSSQELTGGRNRRSGFDSFAGKLGSNSRHIEELYVLKTAAILPCFVIVCRP